MSSLIPLRNNSMTIELTLLLPSRSAIVSSNTIDAFFFVGLLSSKFS